MKKGKERRGEESWVWDNLRWRRNEDGWRSAAKRERGADKANVLYMALLPLTI